MEEQLMKSPAMDLKIEESYGFISCLEGGVWSVAFRAFEVTRNRRCPKALK